MLFQCNDTVMAMKWREKRDIHMISTFHRGNFENSKKIDRKTRERIQKPDCVLDYTINVRPIDKTHMQVSTIECVRQSIKCGTRKYFFIY